MTYSFLLMIQTCLFEEVFTDEDDDVFTTIETKKWRDKDLPADEYAKSTQIK